MKKLLLILLCIAAAYYLYNNSDRKIEQLLQSQNKDDIILGAFKAGESRKERFVPLLLMKCNDPRISHHLKFKGISVYQAKMIALKKISHLQPPATINSNPDSTIINFYMFHYQRKHLIATL